jgi:hypothetical protein
MIFHFFKSYSWRSENFIVDIPVSFVIPSKFNSLEDLGVLGSHNKEVCDVLASIGVTNNTRHSFRISKNEIIVNLKEEKFNAVKTVLLRDQKLRELLD